MAKYKIGQKVRFLSDSTGKTFLHITQIEEITCYAGTQVFYGGRMWIPNPHSLEGGYICARELWKVNEIELAPIKEEKPKKKGK